MAGSTADFAAQNDRGRTSPIFAAIANLPAYPSSGGLVQMPVPLEDAGPFLYNWSFFASASFYKERKVL